MPRVDTWNTRISHISAAQSLYKPQFLPENFETKQEASNYMETSICHTNKTNAFCSSNLLRRTTPCSCFPVSFPTLMFKTRKNPTQGPFLSPNLRHGLVMECAKWGKDLEAEMMNLEGEDWIDEMGEKCKERKGLVEILECLEREAIMGDDEGTEAVDYNRRALLFDKSSQVFTALKEQHAANPSAQS